MSPTRKKQPLPEYALHICDDCLHATYDTDERNRNIQTGKPILIICALHPFPKIVIGTRACENYKSKHQLKN